MFSVRIRSIAPLSVIIRRRSLRALRAPCVSWSCRRWTPTWRTTSLKLPSTPPSTKSATVCLLLSSPWCVEFVEFLCKYHMHRKFGKCLWQTNIIMSPTIDGVVYGMPLYCFKGLDLSLFVQCLAYAPQLVKALSNGLDPEKACTAIHMCTNGTGRFWLQKRMKGSHFEQHSVVKDNISAKPEHRHVSDGN
jgi:hypothetical protein